MNTLQLTRRQAPIAAWLLATGPAAFAQDGNLEADPNTERRLALLAGNYYREYFSLFPMDATEGNGDAAFEAMFEVEIAPAHRERQRALYRNVLQGLRNIDLQRLTRSGQVTYELLHYEATQRLNLLRHPSHLVPLTHMDSVPVRMAQWAGGKAAQPMKTAAHYEHYLARLEKMPAWIAQAIRNMEEGMRKGITLPRPLVERTVPQIEALLPADAQKSPYLDGVREFPEGVAQADRARIAKAYRAVVTRDVIPSLRRLRSFLKDRYLPAARTTAGIGAVPGGADWYMACVAWSTTTGGLTPQQIHDTGLKEVARIRGEMEKVKARFGFEGLLTDFLKSLPARPELHPFRSEEEVLKAYAALNEKVRPQLPRLFERAPKAPLEIRAVEPIRRDTASAHYVPPALDGSRPGAFYTVVHDPARYRTTGMTALFLHEGQPGHHYHIALQQELPMPKFRRAAWYDAYGEGWALYAEGLGHELGLYDDPNAYLGRLGGELHRAMRLVVDTGLHALGWTREQAIDYFMELEGRSEVSARRATERYMAWPGQALAYKTGELKLVELRERARRKLGARFDIRAFHTQVLGEGSMPLQMLEAKIDDWIARTAR